MEIVATDTNLRLTIPIIRLQFVGIHFCEIDCIVNHLYYTNIGCIGKHSAKNMHKKVLDEYYKGN